jgi:two-component system phosphate regulon sensor histidine kinase PhoR
MWPALELTQRRARAERRLRSGERLLDTVLEALPDPLFLVDSRMVLRRVNQAARRAFDLPPGELPLGRAIRDPAILAAVNSALAGGIGDSAVYNPVSDRLKVFAARVEPVDLGEEGRGALIALREQTEQLMIERMRSDFVANASHEMRTPLASIIGFIETMRGPARNDVVARDAFLVTMAEEAARMQRLVEDLLSLSRIELAEHKPPEHEVELPLLVDQVRGALAPMAERAGMAIEAELPGDLPVVRGDRDQLHQLLSNLVDNALKYAAGGRRVRIEARAWPRAPAEAGPLSGRPSLALAVIDYGEGISPELIPRITERFFRIDKARSRRIGGTGLGLAIVKHIVRRHRGQLVIESELGQGSRFTVYLPAQPRAAT